MKKYYNFNKESEKLFSDTVWEVCTLRTEKFSLNVRFPITLKNVREMCHFRTLLRVIKNLLFCVLYLMRKVQTPRAVLQ